MKTIPTPQANPDGLNQRYKLTKANGSPVSEEAVYFVLRLDSKAKDMQHVRACREAARVYCQNAPKHMQRVARELDQLIDALERQPMRPVTKPPHPACIACGGLGEQHPDNKGSACYLCQ